MKRNTGSCLSAHTHECVNLIKTETSVTVGDDICREANNLQFITSAYSDYFYRLIPLASIAKWKSRWTLNLCILSSNLGNRIFFFFFFCHLLQCKFNITVSTQILLVYYPL